MQAPFTRRTLLRGALLGLAGTVPGIPPVAAASPHPAISARRAGQGSLDYRLFIATAGTADLKRTSAGGGQYFSLTGAILRYRDLDTILARPLERLKATYFSTAQGSVILNRKDVVDAKPPFDALRDPKKAAQFNDDLLNLLRAADYTALTATIDQPQHHQTFGTWKHPPYHYCMMALIEGYTRWLNTHSATGDAMMASRGGREDMRLKTAFATIWDAGTDQVRPERIRPFLTSKQLKVKPSGKNIAGLQLAALLAQPGLLAAQAAQTKASLPTTLDGQIAQIMRATKFDRAPNGGLDGWGIIWIA
jgi:hypothetical protein